MNRTQRICQRGILEVVISRTTHKECKGCNKNFECSLENFPKATTNIREGTRITYLRAKCRMCHSKRPNRVQKATPEQYRKNSLSYYNRNKRLINWKKRRKVLWKRLDKMFQTRNMNAIMNKE
jgi:hypothetical protein